MPVPLACLDSVCYGDSTADRPSSIRPLLGSYLIDFPRTLIPEMPGYTYSTNQGRDIHPSPGPPAVVDSVCRSEASAKLDLRRTKNGFDFVLVYQAGANEVDPRGNFTGMVNSWSGWISEKIASGIIPKSSHSKLPSQAKTKSWLLRFLGRKKITSLSPRPVLRVSHARETVLSPTRNLTR